MNNNAVARRNKAILMFTPLVALFAVIGFATYDMRHPTVASVDCSVLATGLSASQYRTDSNVLYTSSGQKVHDVALRCQQLGIVVINDFDVFVTTIDPGDTARLRHRTYQWLPPRWSIAITHVNKKK